LKNFQHQPKTILIVDDDLTNRLVLRALLKDSGYESVEVENGELAVEAVENNHIDIILLDVMMPVMDGYQAAKIIKGRSDRFIPIIFLTAMTDEVALAKCIEAGGDDFLTKPYNHILLKSKIDSMLRISGLYQNIESKSKAIEEHNLQMLQEMNVTKKLFKKISSNDLRGDDTGLHYSMSPMTMFNGDLILAEKNQTMGLDVLVGDFTGHGLSAAIGAIPMFDIFHSMTQKCFSFTEVLTEANSKLMDLLPTHMFMAAGLISVDRSNNVASIVNAGLPDIYLYRNNEIVRTFKSKNIPLGISKIASQQIEVEMIPLEYGDRFYVATDGVMEATNKDGDMFGLERLLKTFEDNTQGSELFDSILSDCAAFCEGADQTDDITLLELCHLENVHYGDDAELNHEYRDPSNWSMQFSLDIKSLRQFDALPFIMQAINQLQPLESGRNSLHTVLTEMFANALDHGVLKLDSSMKSTPQGYMEFYQEKQKRLESLDEGNIQITLTHELNDVCNGGRLTVVIIDSGEGFDFEQPDTNKNDYSGRGLKLVSSLCTKSQILGKGNAIMAYYDWQRDP
jgi:two-component system, HptB-dependent secretion and biofilm response regulator